ncbi:MAG: XTP/dITP diphosphohydrolase/tetrapyrrole methylase family protein/MazG family protein [Lentimonas sp.]|jgi:MazG family protein
MSSINKLVQTVEALRDPDTGCPWDVEQNHQSIADCLIDECCELLQTIDRLDIEHMQEELGDVLLQVVMHAQMAKEAGHFDFDEVCELVNEKLITRHPHVFGDTKIKDSNAVLEQWDAIKAKEKKRGPKQKGLFKDLPNQLPALLFARSLFKQLQKLDLNASALVDKTEIEEIAENLNEADVGKQLFEITAACRLKGIDPESALRRHAQNIVDQLEKS